MSHRLPESLLLLLVMTGCVPELGRADVVPIMNLAEFPAHSAEVEDGAAEILGLELSREAYVPDHTGVVVIIRAKHPTEHGGATLVKERCVPVIWAHDRAITLAHELGHALGLEHVDDPGNLMHPDAAGLDLDEDQIDFMRSSVWWLHENC